VASTLHRIRSGPAGAKLCSLARDFEPTVAPLPASWLSARPLLLALRRSGRRRRRRRGPAVDRLRRRSRRTAL